MFNVSHAVECSIILVRAKQLVPRLQSNWLICTFLFSFVRATSVSVFCYSRKCFNPHLLLLMIITSSGAYKIRICFVLCWRYLRMKLISHKCQSSIRSSIYFSLIAKSKSNPFLEQSVLKKKGKVFCSRNQRQPLLVYELTTG